MQYQEYNKAFEVWLGLAEHGNAQAQYDLGVLLHNGMGMEINSEEALRWFKLASNNNHIEAEAYLGSIYTYGFRGPQNIEKALYYLKKAADKGHEGARGMMANIMSKGLPDEYKEE